jgi:hypothetical protein
VILLSNLKKTRIFIEEDYSTGSGSEFHGSNPPSTRSSLDIIGQLRGPGTTSTTLEAESKLTIVMCQKVIMDKRRSFAKKQSELDVSDIQRED